MDNQMPDWTEQLRVSPMHKQHFTEERISSTLKKIKRQSPLRKVRMVWLLSLLLAVSGTAFITQFVVKEWQQQAANDDVRSIYGGDLSFKVFPDGTMRGGSPFGYIFSFDTPFSELKGKVLSIDAVHMETGQRLKAVLPHPILEPSSGYQGLERFTASITLPFGGSWRYDVKLDGHVRGQAVVEVPDPAWEISPVFPSGAYLMRGIEGEIGFVDAEFVVGIANKYTWQLWGTEEQLSGDFQVKAVKQGSNRIINITETASLGELNDGADRQVSLTMLLQEAGRWRLLPILGGKLLDTIVIDVLEEP